MINDVFMGIETEMGVSLFADDGAIWKRGRNLKFITKKLQGAITKIGDWLTRSILDYGCVVYGSAAMRPLKNWIIFKIKH